MAKMQNREIKSSWGNTLTPDLLILPIQAHRAPSRSLAKLYLPPSVFCWIPVTLTCSTSPSGHWPCSIK